MGEIVKQAMNRPDLPAPPRPLPLPCAIAWSALQTPHIYNFQDRFKPLKDIQKNFNLPQDKKYNYGNRTRVH